MHVNSTVAGATLVRADGTNGTVFSVIDDLSDSLMSVNNSAGLPVLEVFADDRVVAGQYGSGDFTVINNRVGIGTSNPSYKLDVRGSAVNSRVGLMEFGSWPLGATYIYLQNNSLSLIGANYGFLQGPAGETFLNAAAGQVLHFRIGNVEKWAVTSAGILESDGAQTIRTSTGALTLATNGANGDIILSPNGSGKVGIGVTSPTQKLDIVGSYAAAGDSSGILKIRGGATGNDTQLNFGVSADGGYGWIQATDVGATNNINIILGPLGGNLGVGAVSANARVESYQSSNAITFNYLATNLNNTSPIPVYGFDVTNGVGETRSIKAGIGYERHLTNGRGTIHFYNDSVNDTSNLTGNRTSAGDIKMSIDNSGNVGIGTPTPSYTLQVNGTFYVNNTAYINGTVTVDDNLYVTAGNDFIITDSDLSGTYNFFMDSGVGYIRIDDPAGATGKLNVNSGLLFVGPSGGNVGINTITPSYRLQVNGSFAATTKSFDIPHPTKENKRLIYASLEGPENGVYVRGKNNSPVIELPDYWTGLVDEETISATLTAIGKDQNKKIRNYSIEKVENNKVYIYTDSFDNIYNYYFVVYGERKDVSKLIVEKETE